MTNNDNEFTPCPYRSANSAAGFTTNGSMTINDNE